MMKDEITGLKKPKVFISYAWADELSALAIDQWLRNHGARVVIDRRDFIPGNDIEAEIVRCIRDAGKVVCIYSENSAKRPYPELERRIASALERDERSKGTAHRRLIYFCIDDSPLPLEALPRLAIKAANTDFDSACEELWRSILARSAPPKELDLARFKDNPPWKMNKKEQDEYVKGIRLLDETVKELAKSYDSMRSDDVQRIAKLFADFQFLSTQRYLERVISVLKQQISQRSPSQESLEKQLKEMAETGRPNPRKSDPAVFLNLAFLEAQERRVLELCQTASDLIEAGLKDGEPHQLDHIRRKVDEMFGIE